MSSEEKFQQLMQRIWLDNALSTGTQEARLLMREIAESAAASREWLAAMAKDKTFKAVLLKEWETKERELEELSTLLNSVQIQIKAEKEILKID